MAKVGNSRNQKTQVQSVTKNTSSLSPRRTRYSVAPTFSALHSRLKVSSSIRGGYSAVTIVDLITPQDHQTIRLDFITHVYTLLASLLIFTVLTLGVFCLLSEVLEWFGMLISLAATLALCVSLSIFVYWTNFDFTTIFSLGYLLIMGFLVLVVIVLYAMILTTATEIVFYTVMTFCILVLFALTTQMVIGGGRTHEIPNRRYIRAAFALYVEIMAIYFYLPLIRLVK